MLRFIETDLPARDNEKTMLLPFLATAAIKNVAPPLVAVLAILLVGIRGSASQVNFAFQPQQSVYIVAVRGRSGDPWMSTLSSSAWSTIYRWKKKSERGLKNVAFSRSHLHCQLPTLFFFA